MKALWSRVGPLAGMVGLGLYVPGEAGVAAHSGRGMCMLNIRVRVQHQTFGRQSERHLGRALNPVR